MKTCQSCRLHHENLIETLQFNDQIIEYCPTRRYIALLKGSLQEQLQNDSSLMDDVTGKPGAIRYNSKGETYCLEKDSMIRLLSHNLQPNEYMTLVQKYGSNQYLLHADFYTDEGIALQPLVYD